MTQKPPGKPVAPNSSALIGTTEPIATKGTAREKFMQKLSTNPKFREAPKSGTGFVIIGAKDLSKPT
jgi:hypothetical protein